MPRSLEFEFGKEKLEFVMHKVDRSKLYGMKVLQVLDDNDDACELSTLAEDGKTLIGKGGTGIGFVDADGNWTDKSSLTAVDLEGKELTPVPSSFASPIPLKQRTTTEDYLDHNIRLIYRLEASTQPAELLKELNEGAIYKFPYSFRGGLEADVGFMLTNEAQEIFFLVGDSTGVEFVGLQQVAPVLASEEGIEDDDFMDFGMI
jgi:hypothetical protein